MSSVSNDKYTVVLFVPGLGYDGEYFDATIQKLKQSSYKVKEYVYSSSEGIESDINMKDFDVERNTFCGINQGYYSQNATLNNRFDIRISSIVSLALTNPNKAILVRLSLQYYPYYSNGDVRYKSYDSILNQSLKLRFIIDAIKNKDARIRIVLIGHSQGGLVNLETAIQRPSSIYKFISISTPYRSVLAADLLEIPIIIGKISNALTGDNFLNKLDDFGLDDTNYQNRILDLSSSPYFNGLHARWNALQNRPPLLVITGTSGHLVTRELDVIRRKQSFDGLVRTSEQKSILHANYLNLANTATPCIIQKTIFKETCFDSVLSPCYYLCPLPNFGISDAMFRTSLRALFNSLWHQDFGYLAQVTDPNDAGVINAIRAGLARNGDYDQLFKNYYDIYASDYSHMYLAQCDEVIGRLLAEIE